MKVGFGIALALVLSACTAGRSFADEMCTARVQNNDAGQRTIDHLRVAATDQARSHEVLVIINRIVPPGHDNITAIHWNCSVHTKPYIITGMSVDGRDMVSGVVSPSTTDVDVENRPLVQLNDITVDPSH